jgi:acetyl esterase/lipase
VYWYAILHLLSKIHIRSQCEGAECVVVSVDYRLGPENPYPAAVQDAVEALEWVYSNGKAELGIDRSRIAVGGSSAQVPCSILCYLYGSYYSLFRGGNLAAIVSLKSATLSPPIPIQLQLLVVPVVDNTATISDGCYASWRENAETAWLPAAYMIWFRDHYLPNIEDRVKWDNSPIFAPEDLVANAPRAWIAVAEMDILRDEGIAYAAKLKKAGVEVAVKVYEGAPHPILVLDGKCALINEPKESR